MSIAPGQEPARSLGQGSGHEIKSGRSPGVAPQDAGESHPSTSPKPETADRLVGVFRAARQVPATRPNKGRKRVAIERDRPRPIRRGRPARSGKWDLLAEIRKFKVHRISRMFRQTAEWNNLAINRGDSDFFTLDPNLATALKNTNTGGISTA